MNNTEQLRRLQIKERERGNVWFNGSANNYDGFGGAFANGAWYAYQEAKNIGVLQVGAQYSIELIWLERSFANGGYVKKW